MLLLKGAYNPSPEHLALFASQGTQVEATPIARIEGMADVVLADGRTPLMNGICTRPRIHIASPVTSQLSCAPTDRLMGQLIQVHSLAANVCTERV